MTPSIASALAVTLVIEMPIVALSYPGERFRLAGACAVATTVTNLVMNAWLSRASGSYDTYLLSSELGASLIEAIVYVAVSRGHGVGNALVASGLANAASFAAGLIAF